MKKLINTKPFTFFIDVKQKEQIDNYLRNQPYGFSAFIRLLVEKETTKYMPCIGLIDKNVKYHILDKLDKNKKYKRVSATIEEIDLIVLNYLSKEKNMSIGSLIRNLIDNEMSKLD